MSTPTPSGPRALVLGGGGITGIAWMLGLLEGLRAAGVDLTSPDGADTVVGTSAGSVVGAQVTGGLDLEELYAEQLRPADREIGATLSRLTLLRLAPALVLPGSGDTKRARVGRLAMRAHPPGDDRRVEVIRSRIGLGDWPERDLRITAVDAESGRPVTFDRHGEADLVHAVAASCAVPLVWPPVTIGGRHYVDGGVRSTTNADLVRGVERLVVLAPLPQSLTKASSIPAQVARSGARRHAAVSPDKQALADIGTNVLDPAKRADAARAGLRQSAEVVDRIRAAWA